jgi:hydrogenase expression/formation protein HypC
MRIDTIDGHQANCSSQGVNRIVDLFLMQDQNVMIGDYVLVHVGYAIQKINAAEAKMTTSLFSDMMTGTRT